MSIICLQEIDRNWRRTNMADQFAEIQQLLPDRYCVFGPSIDVDASWAPIKKDMKKVKHTDETPIILIITILKHLKRY